MNRAESASHKSIPFNARSIFIAWHNLAGPLVSPRGSREQRFFDKIGSPHFGSTARINTASAIPAGRQTAFTQK